MAKLSAKSRKRLPSSSFVYPSVRKYPIHDVAHARVALSMAARSSTYGNYATVAAAVKRRYPSIKTGGTKRRRTRSRRK